MIRVLLVDPSPAFRKSLSDLLATDPELHVLGEAGDGAVALDIAKRRRPSLILMSVKLPAMDGFEATRSVMTHAPTPIVILSDNDAPDQVELSMNALRAGAVSVQPRPDVERMLNHPASARDFLSTIKAMAQVKLVRRWAERGAPAAKPAPAVVPPRPAPSSRVVAIGASTGGPAAIQRILSELPVQFPYPILIVQHIAPGFHTGFVAWLNASSPLPAKVAEHGEPLRPQTVYIAGDRRHLGLSNRSTILLSAEPPIGGFRPSATFLFETVSNVCGPAAINLILTGMGRDGVDGLRVARKHGALILAQDEASSVVFGMPASAIEAGLPDAVLPLSKIAGKLTEIWESERG